MIVDGWLYRGRVFRELLETRWAAFFDALELVWRYEVGGFEPTCGRWIPSGFWLPEVGRHVEVHAHSRPLPDDFHPVHGAWAETWDQMEGTPGARLVVIYGEPVCLGQPDWVETDPYPVAGAWDVRDSFGYRGYVWNDDQYVWTECPKCHKVGIEFEGRAGRLCDCFDNDKVRNNLSPRLLMAYQAAYTSGRVRRPLWHGLLRPGLDRRLMRG